MAKQFYERLRNYYKDVANVLTGSASAASIFPNPVDIGGSREKVYAEFLKLHVPTNCNVFFGGFLFGLDGSESRQIDIIVTNDSSHQYNFFNQEGGGKTFACIEGTIAVVSLKSYLSSKELRDSLGVFASLPDKEPLDPGRLAVLFNTFYYQNWPFKIIYASDGISEETMKAEIADYYKTNKIPAEKRPDLIHIAGKYYTMKMIPGLEVEPDEGKQSVKEPMVAFTASFNDPDVTALAYAILSIQEMAFQSNFIIFHFNKILTNLWGQTIRK